MNVVLFGGGLQVLSSARSLKKVGHVVDVIGSHNEISKRCRFVNECFDIDIINLKIDYFVYILKAKDYAVIIPMEDEYASWLSLNKDVVEKTTGIKCAVMDYSVFAVASNKTELMCFCKLNNIPHPKTEIINDNYDDLAEKIGFPSLIKPSRSAGSRGICIVNNIDELRQSAKNIIAEYGECTLQEYISSKDYYFNAMLYRTKDGRYSNCVITKILRYYPIKGGSSSFCVTIENEKIFDICKKTLNSLNWVGFADFDILENGDGDYRIIEINPRIPASVHAAAISGVHFANIIVDDLVNKKLSLYTYKSGMQLRCLGLDIAWFLSSPNRFRCTPSWFKFLGRNLSYQEGGIKDFWAMCTSIWLGVKKQMNPEFRRKKSGMN